MPELAARIGPHDPVLLAAGDDVDVAPWRDQLPACAAVSADCARTGVGAPVPVATRGTGSHDDVARGTGDPGFARRGLAGHGAPHAARSATPLTPSCRAQWAQQ